MIEVHAMLLVEKAETVQRVVDQGVSRSKQRRRCYAGSVLTRAAYTVEYHSVRRVGGKRNMAPVPGITIIIIIGVGIDRS